MTRNNNHYNKSVSVVQIRRGMSSVASSTNHSTDSPSSKLMSVTITGAMAVAMAAAVLFGVGETDQKQQERQALTGKIQQQEYKIKDEENEHIFRGGMP